MRRLAFLTVALMIAGCSLFVDLDGLSAGPDAGESDVFVPNDVASTADGAPQDAGADASHFCPDSSIVCDDFDEAPLGALWSDIAEQNGKLIIDDASAFSPPNSLHLSLPDNPSNVQRFTELDETFTALKSLDCQFEVRLVSTNAPDDTDVELFGLNLTAPGYPNGYDLELNMQNTDFYIELDTDTGVDGGVFGSSDRLASVTLGSWQQLRLTTDFSRVQVAVNGSVIYDKPLGSPLPSSAFGGTLSFGQVSDTEIGAWEYRMDDVLCTGN